MLATAVSSLPSGEGWAYEFKWDGVRALLQVTDRGARLISRQGNDVSAGYPELIAQAADIGEGVFDGEIVAFVEGRPLNRDEPVPVEIATPHPETSARSPTSSSTSSSGTASS